MRCRMRARDVLLVAVFAAMAATPSAAQNAAAASQSSTGVAATVNGAVISNYDIDQRTALFVATSGVRPGADDLVQIRAQMLRALEDETLEMQEAAKHRIAPGSGEIEKAIQNIAADNKITANQLMATLSQAGVTAETFAKQVGVQLVWQKLVAARYGADILITDQQIDDALARLKSGADKPQFLVSEIYLAVDKPEDDAAVRAAADRILQQVKNGAPFATIAGQFSQSPSAASGGDIGWVLQGQLPDELDHALGALQPGQISGPVRAEGGYYILLLRNRLEPAGSAAAQAAPAPAPDPDAPLPLDRFLIPLPANADATLKSRAMALAQDVKNRARVCADLAGVAAQLTGTIHQQLGTVSPKDLDPAIRAALAFIGPGESITPLFSSAGVELIMRCDAAAPVVGVFQMPTREQIRQQLQIQKMSVFAKAYLAELRRNAIISGER